MSGCLGCPSGPVLPWRLGFYIPHVAKYIEFFWDYISLYAFLFPLRFFLLSFFPGEKIRDSGCGERGKGERCGLGKSVREIMLGLYRALTRGRYSNFPARRSASLRCSGSRGYRHATLQRRHTSTKFGPAYLTRFVATFPAITYDFENLCTCSREIVIIRQNLRWLWRLLLHFLPLFSV